MDIQKMKLVTSLNLNYTDEPIVPAPPSNEPQTKPVFQFVYGSQVYGTLFGVFARFSGTTLPDGSFSIENVTLKIMNYQGALNIGFKRVGLIAFDGSAISFEVEGTSILDEDSLKFPNPIIIRKGQSREIIFDRKLHPLPLAGVTAGSNTTTAQARSQVLPYFDTEFQYRNGIDHYNQPLRPGMSGYKEPVEKAAAEVKFFFPSLRCHQSEVNLYHS